MANDTFVMSVRQAAELDHAFARNGWSAEDIKKLSAGSTLTEFRKILLGHASIATVEHDIDLDADPFVPEGLTVEEHHKGGSFSWDVTRVQLWLSEGQRGSKYVEGNKLRKELAGSQVFNANLLDHLLKHTHLIPEEWKGKYVFFWGTIYRGRGGGLCVRCLYWDGGRWRWFYGWLYFVFSDVSPAALRAS